MATDAEVAQQAVERFLNGSRQPALLEPGEPQFLLTADNFEFALRNDRLIVQVWDGDRALFRKIRRIKDERSGQIEFETEHFGKRAGEMTLLDLARPKAQLRTRESSRLAFREEFRRYLSRQFPGWRIQELTSAPDLEHSLSPAYPRGSVTKGPALWACIGAPPESDPDHALTFGLIWYNYLKAREVRRSVEGLAIFLPEGSERTSALRMQYLKSPSLKLYIYSTSGFEAPVDITDYSNLEGSVEPIRFQAPKRTIPAELKALQSIAGFEAVDVRDASTSLRIRGFEFARYKNQPTYELLNLARALSKRRSPDAEDRQCDLFLSRPELWLEHQVRANLKNIDASLIPTTVHTHIPATAATDQGILDLLACDCTGRMAILELKASQDLHLPLQALDYWIRVRKELREGRLASLFYPTTLRQAESRIFLVAPALEFHPTTPLILQHFHDMIDIQQVGLGMDWRRELKVVFRLNGGESRT